MGAEIRKKLEIYPAPCVPGIAAPARSALSALLESCPAHGAALFALGNIALREGCVEEAIRCYLQALEETPDAAQLRCNLGIAYQQAGLLDEAMSNLRQSMLRQADLVLSCLHLAEIQMIRGEEDNAIGSLERLLRLSPENARGNLLLAELYDRRGQKDQAKLHYDQAYTADPKCSAARNRLGELCFLEGKELIDAGKYEEAFAVWASGYKKYARAFSAEKRIAAGMKDLAGGFVKYGRMEAALAEFEQRLAAQADDRRAYYELFGRFFFSLGLIAELYVPFDMLDEEHARITREIDQPGQFPFLHYRLGILLSYMGKLAAALEEFSSCADHLPASKKLALKLERIIEFVKRVMLVVNKSMGIELSSAPVDAWVEAGFADIFQQQAWKKTGASPEEAAAWRSAGFSAVQCKEWRPYGLDRLSVRAWVDQGFTSPKEAARLAKGDLNPVEAKKWLQYFPDAAHDIVQWRKAGFIEPEEAVIWGSLFTFASEAARWRDLGFQPAEVEICLERGIKDPFTAKGQQQAEQLAAVREDEELE